VASGTTRDRYGRCSVELRSGEAPSPLGASGTVAIGHLTVAFQVVWSLSRRSSRELSEECMAGRVSSR
jgi:hypothetical protein